MKLYYSPGACSLSPHIVLHEAGLAYEPVLASTKTHKLADGTDFYSINPLGYVPVLELDDGTRLREGPAIVQYLADRVPDRRLAPPAGTLARYRLMEWLNFISTELHKGFGALFNPAFADAAKTIVRAQLERRIGEAERRLGSRSYALGEDFTVADAYLFTVLGWAKYVNVDLSPWPGLGAYLGRVAARPAVQAALAAEGLIPTSQ